MPVSIGFILLLASARASVNAMGIYMFGGVGFRFHFETIRWFIEYIFSDLCFHCCGLDIRILFYFKSSFPEDSQYVKEHLVGL